MSVPPTEKKSLHTVCRPHLAAKHTHWTSTVYMRSHQAGHGDVMLHADDQTLPSAAASTANTAAAAARLQAAGLPMRDVSCRVAAATERSGPHHCPRVQAVRMAASLSNADVGSIVGVLNWLEVDVNLRPADVSTTVRVNHRLLSSNLDLLRCNHAALLAVFTPKEAGMMWRRGSWVLAAPSLPDKLQSTLAVLSRLGVPLDQVCYNARRPACAPPTGHLQPCIAARALYACVSVCPPAGGLVQGC